MIPEFLPRRNVRVPVKQDISRHQHGRCFGVEMMTVCNKNDPVSGSQETVFSHDRKFKHHLVYLAVTVPPDTENSLPERIEHSNDLLRSIFFRKIIAGTVVQKIPQQQQAACLFPVQRFQHPSAVKRGTVYIRGNH